MQFFIDHDWQENMATPRAKVGERAKTHLLILLCAIWLCVGLIGHSPWKPLESQSISIIQGLIDHPFLSLQSWTGGHWIAPISAGHPALDTPPLFYWAATGFAHAFSFLLPTHDAARLSVGAWMLVTLLMMGLSGRELWNPGVGRQTNFIFIGCLGLVVSAHTLMPEVAALTGISMAFYALALVVRKPLRAMWLLCAGLLTAFLSTGLLPAATIISATIGVIFLPAIRQQAAAKRALILGLLLALPGILLWCWLCQSWAADLWTGWWYNQQNIQSPSMHLYFIRTLAWYAWPALPFAFWGLWRFRQVVLHTYRFQLCLIFFVCAFLLIGFFSDRSEVNALPLLVPLTALAAGSIETLKRGAAGALNWFGLILFGLLIAIAWLGWWAMLNGTPVKLYHRLSYLSGLQTIPFNVLYGVIAVAVTLIWLSGVVRSKHSNRSSATNWAIGMTCAWTVFMSLWLPMIEAARTYQPIFEDLRKHLPKQRHCISSHNIGSSQADLLHYHAGIHLQPDNSACDLLLIEDQPGKRHALPGNDWQLIWEGEQSRQSKEFFRLFQRH
ncbi:4-amino-4-deoxy-L-arabinose transferase [Methylophilus rhizosphaerae]|uniref:4-amino-4-deoxy-L-arabinose transferase n=1 Tax=Methylophilus rhizosphaerae TaxID=492660 RepID=A0A1G9CUU7_9PROT|nr:glycosyl transferase [Methylophilus rhizosphaerae]SDK55442.1 4-amino-4-deoxy-L-arabinose transferase [Methylophilus rhizosphaerae]